MLLYESPENLAGAPDMLDGLAASEVAQVVRAGTAITFRTGQTLFRQGDPHRGIFLLRGGLVRSFYVSPAGREITLADWTGGNFVGGPEIFGGGIHVWSGVALEPGEAVRLQGQTIRRLMADIPGFAVGLVEALAYKGKCYSALLQMLGTRSILERLAHLLLNLAGARRIRAGGRPVIAASPTHEELATRVGATRQWISMTLERFRAQGLIATANRQIVILNPSALSEIAEGERLGAS